MKKVNRRRMNDAGGHNIWRSYSDMMSGLLLLFVLIMAVCLMQAQKNYNDRLAEQTSRLQTQDELEQTREELTQRESEIEEQSLTLTDLQNTLEAQASALATKESEFDEAQNTLTQQQEQLTQQQALLAQQESELEARDLALEASQSRLDEQTQLMSEQQQKIDQIIGVKADLIAALNDEFALNQINVQLDSQTGAIVLDSSVLFALNHDDLTEDGGMILSEILPVYCRVLLSEQYVDYVAEIIIDGYTDSQGDYLSNLTLSQGRAYAVAEYLLGISREFLDEDRVKTLQGKLTANGRSEANLILDENGNEDADASRRVEVKFRLKDEEMMQELSQVLSGAAQTAANGDSKEQEAADGGQ